MSKFATFGNGSSLRNFVPRTLSVAHKGGRWTVPQIYASLRTTGAAVGCSRQRPKLLTTASAGRGLSGPALTCGGLPAAGGCISRTNHHDLRRLPSVHVGCRCPVGGAPGHWPLRPFRWLVISPARLLWPRGNLLHRDPQSLLELFGRQAGVHLIRQLWLFALGHGI